MNKNEIFEGKDEREDPADETSEHKEHSKKTTAKTPKKEFTIDIFEGWCKACGICASFCPRECIRTDEEGTPYIEDSSRCTGCGWCELHCPDFAISVRHKRKLKVQKED